jgi:hypothetical protein
MTQEEMRKLRDRKDKDKVEEELGKADARFDLVFTQERSGCHVRTSALHGQFG